MSQTPRLPKGISDALREKGVDMSDTRTSKQFYTKLGLQSDPNADVRGKLGFHDHLHEVREQRRKETANKDQPKVSADAFVEANESIPHGPGFQKKLNDYEMKCIAQLRAFYGDDLDMMAMDHKRNPMQWTIAQLKKYMELYEKEANELAEQVHAAEEEDQNQ